MVRSHHFARFVEWKDRQAFFGVITEMRHHMIRSGDFDIKALRARLLADTHPSSYSRIHGIYLGSHVFEEVIERRFANEMEHQHSLSREPGARCPICFFTAWRSKAQRTVISYECDLTDAYYSRAFILEWLTEADVLLTQLEQNLLWNKRYGRAPGCKESKLRHVGRYR